MVTPNPSAPADYNPILPLLAMAANSKGSNTSDLSKLFNELMGVMSGSYREPSQMSDQQIEELYSPQTLSIRNSNDPILQSILNDIDAGTPAFKIKEAIRKAIYNTKTIQLQPGQDVAMYDSLVDTLLSEKKTVDEKKYALANKETIFEKYGLPDIKERFDPTQMPEYADLYNTLLNQRDVASKERDAKVRAIEQKFLATQPKPGEKTASFNDLLGGLSYKERAGGNESGPEWRRKLSGSQLQAAQTQAQRINDFLSGKGVMNAVKDPNTGDYKSDWWTNDDLDRAVANLENLVGVKIKFPADKTPAKISSRNRAIEEANKNYLQELAGKAAPQRMATTDVANLKNPVTGKPVDMSKAVRGTTTTIPAVNLRDPVARQDELIRLVTEKLGQKMEAKGQTPLSEALISRLILNKQMGG